MKHPEKSRCIARLDRTKTLSATIAHRASKFVCLGLSVLASLVSAGPAVHADNTAAALPTPSAATVRLNSAAKSVLSSDPARAASLAEAAGDLAAEDPTNSPERAIAIATSESIRGEAALRMGQNAVAKPLLAKAYATVTQLQKGSILEADILVARARLESTASEVQSALTDYLSAFPIYARHGDRYQQAVILQDIGLLYAEAGNYARALDYYGQSSATFSGAPPLDYSVANNRATALQELGRYDEATKDYRQALKIARALNSPPRQANVLNNLAFMQANSGQYAAARRSVSEGLSLSQDPASKPTLQSLLTTQADLDLREKRLASAENEIERALEMEKGGGDIGRDTEVHRAAYRIYKALGQDQQALVELEAYQKIFADHQALMASANSALLAARFDFDNQNARIAALKEGELKRDVTLARLRARQSEELILGLLIIAALIFIFLIFYLRALRLSRDRARESNVVLNETNARLENALQAKTQFLATTSHEIRTPLNGILGMTEVILADQQASGWVRQRLSLIHDAGKAMRTLVDDLLDMSKMDAAEIVLHREVVDLPTLLWEVEQFWRTHAESAGLALTLDIRRAPVMIVEDARRLRQILSNLLSNAVKFTPAGSIVMSAETMVVDGVERLIIRMVDTGIGIPPESRELVFEKFTQLDAGVDRKYGGTGLGLSIARTLASAMGGDITLDAGPTSGCAFTVNLPLERVLSQRASAVPPAKSASQTLGGLRVVIVEPNPIRQSNLRAALERKVETIVFVASAREVVDIARSGEVDVAIATLPKGERDGDSESVRDLEVLAAAAQTHRVQLVVIVDEGVAIRDLGLEAYNVTVFERPVSTPRLLEHLEGLCGVAHSLDSVSA